MNTVGKKVRYFRQIKGLSQENLANYIDKSQNWVSELENGEKEISKELKTAISNFLEIDESFLNSDNNITFQLSQVNFIKSKNCTLSFSICNTDEGIVTENNIDFNCQLTLAGYTQLLQNIEPFCQKETKGYKYLYDIDSSIDLLFSPSGGSLNFIE